MPMDKFVIRPILLSGYYCSFMNFEYIYVIDISIPLQIRHCVLLSLTLGLLVLQCFSKRQVSAIIVISFSICFCLYQSQSV